MKPNHRIKRIISMVLVVFIFTSLFTGCFDRREVDDLAYVMAIGIDKGKTNFIKLTFQIAKPQGGGEGGGGGGGEEKSFILTTIESPSIFSGLNMVNTFVSRQVNLSHIKAIVFSKELAQQGVEPYIHAMARGREFRPNMYVVVARGEAEEYIRSIKPELEPNPGKYYELSYRGYQYTAMTANSQFHYFYNYSESLYRQAVAILAGVNKFESSKDFNVENATYREKGRTHPLESDFKAGDVTKTGEVKGEIMGLAVFDGDKMVGELDGEEAMYHLMTTGEYGYAFVTIPDPKVKDRFVLLNIRQSRKPRHNTKMVDGKPQINTKVILEADILSIQSTVNYEKGENLKTLEEASENFIKTGILRYLNKTAKDYHSDICGFGGYLKKNFLTWQEWQDFHWKARYKDSVFNVDVDLKVRRPGLLIRSLPSVDSQSKEAVVK
ncbi:MAG: Ger(x)C family spore germination protein [Clostridia bacterium]|nr:Ger(x)C family spore germination protein [Clostridia bacterium]